MGYEIGEWLNGWSVKPDTSVNRQAFAVSYFKNKERWDKAFTPVFSIATL